MRTTIPVKGITTTSSYEDGDCYSLVNARLKNGALHPVPVRKIVQEFSRHYDIVFVHHNNDYENWIGIVKDSGRSVVYWKIREAPEEISSVDFLINNIQQIGNILSLISGDTVFYMLYNSIKYLFIGELPQIPAIGFTTNMYSITRPFTDVMANEPTSLESKETLMSYTQAIVYGCMDKLQNGYDSNATWHEGNGYMLFDACFIRYAFRLYDGTITKHSPPILVFPRSGIYDIKRATYSWVLSFLFVPANSSVTVEGYKINMAYDFTLDGEWTNWKDIIKSVDIFMSPPVGISDIEKIRDDMELYNGVEAANRSYNLIKEDVDEVEKGILDTSTFYLVRSIDLGSWGTASLPSSSDVAQGTDTLVQQEVMSGDDFSHHKIGGLSSYVYNERLHLSDITTNFFRGFPLEYNVWSSKYNGYLLEDLSVGEQVVIGVELDVSGAIRTVYSELSAVQLTRLIFLPFFSYPDSRAKSFSIYRKKQTSDQWYRVFHTDMEVHPLLGISYYLHNHGLSPVTDTENVAVTLPNVYEPVIISEHNKIKVSALDNPLVFPNANTYTAGDGEILAMATNSMNVADFNYGQYPLYVFTKQGIWTLNVGSGEVVYSTQSSPTSKETPVSSVVCPLPDGVAFLAKRGLMVINGSSVSFISPQIEEDSADLKVCFPFQFDDSFYYQLHFRKYLKTAKYILYDSLEDEIIVCSAAYAYNVIYSFRDSMFYQSTEIIDNVVENTFPDLYVMEGNSVKDYSQTGKDNAFIAIISRPMTFGTTDRKCMERMILRASLYGITDDNDVRAAVFASYDGIHFGCLRGMRLSNVEYMRDMDLGMLGASKYNRYLFIFSGTLGKESDISFLDVEVNKEYDNTKMR